MRVGPWVKRASFFLLVMICLQIVVATAEVVRAFASYWLEPERVQEDYNRMSETIESNMPGIARPDIKVTTDGPDLKIEAGYLSFKAASGPSISGSEYVAAISAYAPGDYRLHTAPNAHVVVQALTLGLEEFLSDKIEGHIVETEILGNADGLPVRFGYTYSGDLGIIWDSPYYSYNTKKIETMRLVPGVTQHTNESIAFLRALEVRNSVSNSRQLSGSRMAISTYINPQIGPDYRQVIIRVTIKDAFAEEYNKIPRVLRKLVPS